MYVTSLGSTIAHGLERKDAMVDFKETKIYQNGYLVTALVVLGVAVEYFLKLAFKERRGLNCLAWSDVPVVEMRRVEINGRKRASVDVDVPRGVAESALRLARALVAKLELHGCRVLDAVVPQRRKGLFAREHDLVVERAGVRGRSSVEVKNRTVLKANKRQTWRRQAQQQAFQLWPAAKNSYAERMCVFVEWGPGEPTQWRAINCDVLSGDVPDTPENWKPFFGWAGALAPKARARPKASAASGITSAEQARKRKFDALYPTLRKGTVHGKEMASVSDLLRDMARTGSEKAKKARPTIGEKMPVWARRYRWAAKTWGQSSALSSRTGGGIDGWGATRQALSDLHEALS